MHTELCLKLINIFHRHGERSPLNLNDKPLGRLNACNTSNEYLETVPLKPLSFFSSLFRTKQRAPLSFGLIYMPSVDGECAPGQLTDCGKDNLFNLGQKLKKDYVDSGFISKNYNSNEIHLASTDFQRTIESLQSLIKGMFKSASSVIPINLGKKGVKSLYTSKFCDSYLKDKKIFKRMVVAKHEDNINEIHEYVRKKYPVLNKISGIYSMFDIVTSSLGNKNTFFNNFSKKILRKMENLAVDEFFGHLEDKKNLAISRGQIIKDLHDRIKTVVTNSVDKTKMFILSGHDTTIYPLLMAFNIHDNRWPVFGANIVFETYEAPNNKHYIRVKYNGEVKEIPTCHKNYKNDKSLCLVDEFLRICRQYNVKDRDAICKR